MTPELKKCVDNLLIQSVTLKNLLLDLHDDIDAEQFDEELLNNSQMLRYLKKIRLSDTSDGGKFSYRLNVVIGTRCISEEDSSKDGSDGTIDPILEIRSEFIAQYESECELTIEEIEHFSKEHVYYHVWPYWREVLQSSCARLGIPPIVIPPFRV